MTRKDENGLYDKFGKINIEKAKDKLFDLINDSGHDMEDLIDRLSDKEVKLQLELWQEFTKQIKSDELQLKQMDKQGELETPPEDR